jgi:hypothetical protein
MVTRMSAGESDDALIGVKASWPRFVDIAYRTDRERAMSTFDIIFVSLIAGAFCVFGVVLAWGTSRTAGLHKQERKPAE